MEAWPAAVPYVPLANSFQGTPFRAPNATEFEDGAQRTRTSSTLNVATLRFSIRMENDQFEVFKVWVRDTLINGTLPFTMEIWTGSGFASKRCTFSKGEPYGDNPGQGLRHRVSLVLDVEDY